ncbi:MAG: NAD(P)-binding domain-containing protein, partial [Patescibacteria group bacterium]|nr:NAD(P)-binding domain-containing protein [Patescibacteria group bacterium]
MKNKMQIGFIGLGKMGEGMVSRMLKSKKVEVIGWDISKRSVEKVVKMGAKGTESSEDLVSKLKQKRKIVWLMLPAGKPTENVFQKVLSLLDKRSIIIDGANSNFHDSLRRHKLAEKKGVSMLDVGVSGGIVAHEKGYPMMIGGEKQTYKFCKPIFEILGRKDGFDFVGVPGTGHYVKMVHNAIEYGMMQAIAEGFD